MLLLSFPDGQVLEAKMVDLFFLYSSFLYKVFLFFHLDFFYFVSFFSLFLKLEEIRYCDKVWKLSHKSLMSLTLLQGYVTL